MEPFDEELSTETGGLVRELSSALGKKKKKIELFKWCRDEIINSPHLSEDEEEQRREQKRKVRRKQAHPRRIPPPPPPPPASPPPPPPGCCTTCEKCRYALQAKIAAELVSYIVRQQAAKREAAMQRANEGAGHQAGEPATAQSLASRWPAAGQPGGSDTSSEVWSLPACGTERGKSPSTITRGRPRQRGRPRAPRAPSATLSQQATRQALVVNKISPARAHGGGGASGFVSLREVLQEIINILSATPSNTFSAIYKLSSRARATPARAHGAEYSAGYNLFNRC